MTILQSFLTSAAFSLLVFAALAQYIGKLGTRNILISVIFLPLSLLILYPYLLSQDLLSRYNELYMAQIPAVAITAIATFLIFRLIVEERDLGQKDLPELFLILAIIIIYTTMANVLPDSGTFKAQLNATLPFPRLTIWASICAGAIGFVYLFRGIRLNPSLLQQSKTRSWVAPSLVIIGLAHIGFAMGLPLFPRETKIIAPFISFTSNVITILAAMIHFRYPASLTNWLLETQQQFQRRYYLKEINIDDVIQKLDHVMNNERLYIDSDLTLDKLSQAVGVNRYQLSQLLNSELNVSFTRYIQNFRIKTACAMLIDMPNRTILSIAYDVGFNSQSAFQSAFKLVTGVTPSEYRKRNSEHT